MFKANNRRVSRIIITLILSCIAAFLGFVTARAWNGSKSVFISGRNPFVQVADFLFGGDTLIGESRGQINILLLGVGGAGHDGPYLTDTNIILSIKPSTKEVALISVPRDLGVKIPGHDWRKINSAGAFGEAENPGSGGEFARKVFADTFDVEIPYYIRIDFKAFQELIDEVGGVTVNVPRAFTDKAFPGPNFSYTTIHFDAGVQTLNGQH